MVRRNVLPASVLALLLTPSWVVPAEAADGLELSFDGGRVTVIASNVPVATILMEWSRVGGTDFVAADAIAGPPVTLALRDVPEGEALRVLLRAATGYVAAPRLATAFGLSSFDRVLIMAAARRPAGARPTYAPAPPSATQRTPSGIAPGGTADFGPPGSNPTIETPGAELELLESLRDRYQAPPAPVSVRGRPSMVTVGQPVPGSNADVQTAPRPGMIITPSEQPTGSSPRSVPVRPQVGDRSP